VGRRLTLYLAPGAAPPLDSARRGILVARVGPTANANPVLELVASDSVTGLPVVGRLVVAPGEATIPVYGQPRPGP